MVVYREEVLGSVRASLVSGVWVLLLLAPVFSVVLNVQFVLGSGTIYIRADGSIDPSTAPIQRDGNVYAFSASINETIVIERDNIVVDGAGYSLRTESEWQTNGLYLMGRSNVTITNLVIERFSAGIYLVQSSNNTISGSKMTSNGYGILFNFASNNKVFGNTITNNEEGIRMEFSSYNRIYGNIINANHPQHYGKGISLSDSSNNNITANSIKEHYEGLSLYSSSSYNVISGNYIENNNPYGIALWNPSTSNNVISGNKMLNNGYGIYLEDNCNYNDIVRNNITRNSYGASLWSSTSNKFYHNNFINNTQQTLFHYPGYANVWDDGYPSGGNYWSDYTGIDGNLDGIGDTPYVIDADNQDNYPLSMKFLSASSPVAFFTVNQTILSVGEKITFNASLSFDLDKDILSYRWDFGDGNISSTVDSIITHTYESPSRYAIKLALEDSEGLSSSVSLAKLVAMPTFVSISTDSSSSFIGLKVKVAGMLTNIYGNGLVNETVVLGYGFRGIGTWVPITSATTDNSGQYNIEWIPPATGYFTLKAEWEGNITHTRTSTSIGLSSLPYNQYVFSVESNSTMEGLAFNTTSRELGFDVSGPSGTMGYVKVILAKSLMENIADVRVYLDGNRLNYTATSLDDSWQLYFTYLHSTHKVMISLRPASASFIGIPFEMAVIYGVVLAAIVILAFFILLRRKHRRTSTRYTERSTI